MNKQDFLVQLRKGLSGLPQNDIEERLTFYSEMIEDRIEEGLSEEEAVSAVGSVDEIVSHVVSDIPFTKIAKERIKTKRQLTAWEIVLLVLGAPIWLSLGITAISVIFSLYISLWSVIITLWSVFVALIASTLSCVVVGIIFACHGNVLPGIATFAMGLICAGVSIFMFYGCKLATMGIWIFTKKIAIWIKNCFIKKEKV